MFEHKKGFIGFDLLPEVQMWGKGERVVRAYRSWQKCSPAWINVQGVQDLKSVNMEPSGEKICR